MNAPVPASAPTEPPIDPKTPIQLTLTVGEINQVLFALGKLPLGDVINTFNSIQTQGNMAVAAIKLATQPKQPHVPGEDPPASPPEPPKVVN